MERLLRYFVYLQGSHGNPKKVFTAICYQLLPSVLKVKQLISRCPVSTDGASVSHLCDQISSQLKKLLLAIFNKYVNIVTFLNDDLYLTTESSYMVRHLLPQIALRLN